MSTAPQAPLADDFDLSGVRVATPCHEDWEAMTRTDALALICEKQGDMCVRFHCRADGTVLTADCPGSHCEVVAGVWRDPARHDCQVRWRNPNCLSQRDCANKRGDSGEGS